MTEQVFNIEELDSKHAPLWWHLAGLTYTASGYGKKIPTATMVRLPGSPRWRRVYCCIFSNAGTCYVTSKTGWIVIR